MWIVCFWSQAPIAHSPHLARVPLRLSVFHFRRTACHANTLNTW
ncbi:hypothetical protein PHL092M00_43 [Propionibacterium phage PHL092M00]|uniref:Uncharacterized protein n=1 Tax=Propionibacterium phage PHL092M00 TaxID=1500813 RepID=A0A0E3DN09_9CAUD|nr:hypothetical protein ACQ75_gp43 [Propionibacterium phage PHL092M00]AII29306.1 hypothetical protein PHL092M00_43 [Propionibacterium phage PHL092M00]